MMARYEGAYAATTLIVMGDRSGFAWKDVPTQQLHRRTRLREAEAGQGAAERVCAPTSEFIRRVYLDLTGLPPGPDAGPGFPRRQTADAGRSATS